MTLTASRSVGRALTALGLALGPAGMLAAPPPAAPKPAPERKRTAIVLPLAVALPERLLPPGSDAKAPPRLEVAIRMGPMGPITAACFSPDGSRLLTGAYGRVCEWDLSAGRLSREVPGITGAVHHLAYSRDGKTLAVGGGTPGKSGIVALFDSELAPAGVLEGHADVVHFFAWSPDGSRIATAGLDKQVRVFRVAERKCERTIVDHSDSVYGVAFSPEGARLASCGKDRSVKLFDLNTGKLIQTFSGHNQDVNAVAFAPDGKSLVSSGAEPPLRWWSVETGKVVRTQSGHGGEVSELALSSDNSQVISAGDDRTVRLWNAATGAAVKSFSAGDAVICASLSRDGRRLAAGCWNGWFTLWDVATGKEILRGAADPHVGGAMDYVLAVPAGYLACSETLKRRLEFRAGTHVLTDAEVTRTLLDPAPVQAALRGEAPTPPKIP